MSRLVDADTLTARLQECADAAAGAGVWVLAAGAALCIAAGVALVNARRPR